MTTKKKATTTKKKATTTRKKVKEDQPLTRLVESVIDKGANTAEEIHRAVLDLPISVLDSVGLEDAATEVKKVQDSSIGAVYKLIHDINHKVADLATDLLEERKKAGR
jgi:uncharacterized protein YaaR (DUF327 family)